MRRARRHRALAAAGGVLAVLLAPAQADAAIAFVAAASQQSTSTTLTIAKPTGTTTNDVMVATVTGAGTTTISAPAGWTLIADTTSGAALRTLIYVKVATASEPTSYTFTSAANHVTSGGISDYRGVNPTVPVDAVATATGASGNALGPSVTTSSISDFVLVAAATAKSTTYTAGTGTTERYDKSSTGTTAEQADFLQATAGTTGVVTVTPASGTSAWTAQTVALRDNGTAGLSVSTSSASASFSADLNAGDSTPTYTISPKILDTRSGASAGLGWQLQVTSTTLTTGTASLATTATSITADAGDACQQGAPCVLPTSTVSYPVAVPAGTIAPAAVKFDNAAVGTGEGQIANTATFAVTVPQNAYAGTYVATVTVSIVSGP